MKQKQENEQVGNQQEQVLDTTAQHMNKDPIVTTDQQVPGSTPGGCTTSPEDAVQWQSKSPQRIEEISPGWWLSRQNGGSYPGEIYKLDGELWWAGSARGGPGILWPITVLLERGWTFTRLIEVSPKGEREILDLIASEVKEADAWEKRAKEAENRLEEITLNYRTQTQRLLDDMNKAKQRAEELEDNLADTIKRMDKAETCALLLEQKQKTERRDDSEPEPEFPTGGTMVKMTLLDWFAGQALCGLMANEDRLAKLEDEDIPGTVTIERFALEAYSIADEMIKTREGGSK